MLERKDDHIMQTVPPESKKALTAVVFMKMTFELSPHRHTGQEDQLITLLLHI